MTRIPATMRLPTGPTLVLVLLPLVLTPRLRAQERAAERTRLAAEWGDNAVRFRGQPGQRLAVACPPGEPSRVWGTDLYTDDSSVCTAALHAGLISADRGGVVTLVVAAGAASYAGSTRHGVASQSFGAHEGSFRVEGVPADGDAGMVGWQTAATGLERALDGVLIVTCPPQGAIGRVWGSDVYSDDSSICTAAAHAGAITVEQGGRVALTSTGERAAFTAAARNGISSRAYGSWPRSFTVRAAGAPQPAATSPASGTATGVMPPALVVDGQGTTLVGFSGGWWMAKGISEGGGSYYRTKRVTGSAVEPLVVQVPVVEEPSTLVSLLASWLAGTATPRDIALVDQTSRRDLRQAMITELVIPEMNAAATTVGLLRLTIAAQGVKETTQTGRGTPRTFKPWIASRFRVSVPGLPTTHVSRVDSIVVQRPLSAEAPLLKGAAPAAGTMSISNLVLTIRDSDIAPWRQWLESFVVNGDNGDANEKVVDIELVGNRFQQIRLLRAHNVGILAIRPLPPLANGVRFHRVELYVERLELQ